MINLINKENPLNKQGRPCIRFATGNTEYEKPSKPAIKRNDIRRQIENIQNKKELEALWEIT